MTTSTNTDQHERCAFWADHRFGECEGNIVRTDCECCDEEILCCESHADDVDIRSTAREVADGDFDGVFHR